VCVCMCMCVYVCACVFLCVCMSIYVRCAGTSAQSVCCCCKIREMVTKETSSTISMSEFLIVIIRIYFLEMVMPEKCVRVCVCVCVCVCMCMCIYV